MGFEKLAPSSEELALAKAPETTGRGILDPCTPEELADIEIRRRESAEREAAEAAREQAKAQAEAETQSKLDLIDKVLMPGLQEFLEAENAKIRLSEQQRKDITRFQEIAKEEELRALPASPQLVAVALLRKFNESEDDPSAVVRFHDSISVLHRCTQFPDPTADILCRCVMALVRKAIERKQKGNKE